MLRTAPLGVALLAASASAMPNVRPRATTTADSLTPWVTVADDGTRKTVTPVLTTISGTATVISGAPNDLTATVFTQTSNGDITTSTGTAAVATATATGGSGSFLACSNKDGTNAPWCLPSDGASLNPGTTYYFTWDSSYFTSNTSIMVQGNYLNATTGEVTSQAFTSDKMLASWGFWSLAVTSSLMQGNSATNISVQIAALGATSGSNSQIIKGPTILVTNPPTYHQESAKLPSGAALYIGLPVIFAFVVLCLFGTCLWNRQHRQIKLGNVMSRTRHGHGLGKLPRRRVVFGKQRKEKKAAQRVALLEQEAALNGGQYRDVPDRFEEIPRRDSDALGSLAGTPTQDRRLDFQRPSTRDGRERTAAGGEGNLFREELRRQEGETRLWSVALGQ